MSKITLNQSLTYTVPVLDAKTKAPLREKIKWNGREVESDVVEHVRHKANAVLEVGKDVSKDFAKELLASKIARQHDSTIDGDVTAEVDPTLS